MGKMDKVTGIGGVGRYSVTVTASGCLFSTFRNISQVFCVEQGSIAGEPGQVFVFLTSVPLHY